MLIIIDAMLYSKQLRVLPLFVINITQEGMLTSLDVFEIICKGTTKNCEKRIKL